MMKRNMMNVALAVGLLMPVASAAPGFRQAPVNKCGLDAVVAGTVCLDKYEASVWRVPNPTTTNALLVTKIRNGKVTPADLTAGGASPLGTAGDDYAPCTDNGQNCANDIYAVSLPSSIPSAHITWFQAQEACANARKRLPTSAEWQVGANGTPDPGLDDHATTCNNASNSTSLTGEHRSCVSARGAFDMVGNVAEWVADWAPLSTECPGWGEFSDDLMCLAGASTSRGGPGALVRGGIFFGGAINGPLMVMGTIAPSRSGQFVGFRCAR
jgi:formylglycine-generating enzyme required for sulfatase activity